MKMKWKKKSRMRNKPKTVNRTNQNEHKLCNTFSQKQIYLDDVSRPLRYYDASSMQKCKRERERKKRAAVAQP